MIIKYIDQVAKEIDINPPFIPGDIIQYVSSGLPRLDIVTEVICRGDYTVDLGKKFVKWEVKGSGFNFTTYTKVGKFDLSFEQATSMAQNDARLNQYELKKYVSSTKSNS